MDNNYCVICGQVIPEGYMVCSTCEKRIMQKNHEPEIVPVEEPKQPELKIKKRRKRFFNNMPFSNYNRRHK